ncbi:MAG: DUF4258 domain-containing protein [Spirochaetes bacterium]|nr:DUF4258 domain-containing protein [Spirochaetota bacterium]
MSIENPETYEIKFSIHAVQRMFERGIDESDIIKILEHSVTIEDYPDDLPLASMLLLGSITENPVHVVVAIDKEKMIIYIITVYKPDLNIWNDDFKTRRQRR